MRELAERLLAAPEREIHVVCLPDFFLDHFVAAPPFDEAVGKMRAVHGRGGGNLPGWPQTLAPGGNAANTAHALARLGIHAHLVARTSPFGLAFLRETLGRAGVDLSLVRPDGKLSITTALEFAPEHRNVMLNDPGSVAEYGPDDLDENARTLIEGCDAVLVANWTLARRHGSDLALEVFRTARKGHALTYFDTGDPSSRVADVSDLLARVAPSPDLDVFAMNENELRFYGGEGGVRDVAPLLAKALRAQVDVHTAGFSATWGRRGVAEAPTFPVKVLRATGAGDAWNAGNLLGYVMDLAPAERLRVANAVAGLYLSSPDGLPPTLRDVARYVKIGVA